MKQVTSGRAVARARAAGAKVRTHTKLARVGALAAAVTAVAAPAAWADLDHPFQTRTATAPGVSSKFLAGGEGAQWDLLTTITTLNPQSDLDFFTQKGQTYASVGMLGSSVNGGGQMIVRLTDKKGAIKPEYVSNHPSATCVSNPSAALGLQHDVEATPKGDVLLNTKFPDASQEDAQLLIDATDAGGRCHDQGTAGLSQLGTVPRGGLEIIDITDIGNPKEIALTSHVGEAHTVNVDPRRPHIAYAATSDAVVVDAQGKRANETNATNSTLDGFEVVDLRSCLQEPLGTLPADATLTQKRELCKPEVYRYRWPSTDIALGHTTQNGVHGCHELEVYPDDKLTCGAGGALIVLDLADAFDDNGTPRDFTDDKPRGTPLPCAVRDSSTQLEYFKTGAKITDCVTGKGGADLRVKNWIENLGAPSLAGVEHVGSAFHMGRENLQGQLLPKYGPKEDIDFNHEVEFTRSRDFLIATDERGGGVTGGSQCDSADATGGFANGGVHVFAADRLQKSTPNKTAPAAERAQIAWDAYAKNSKGGKAIYRPVIRTEPKGSMCTAHVMQQIPGQNRIFMGWYTQGTQVIDIYENKDGTVDLREAGWFIPENANQWVSAIFKVEKNKDGTYTYFGATGDGIVGDAGRNGMDVYKVTLPEPPKRGDKAPGPRSKRANGGLRKHRHQHGRNAHGSRRAR